ncbi:PEP-CTERM system TPR-repeat protein PrsT [Methylothermus subterraneus]
MANAQKPPVNSPRFLAKAKKPKALIGVGLALWLGLSGCGDRASDLEHLARAKESQDRGDLRTSVIELKNALQKNPSNAEARRLLGEISAKLGDGETAEKELRRAIDLGVAREAVLLPLAEALKLQGKFQALLDEITLPPSLPPESQALLAAYRGDAWLALNKPEQARREYEEALRLDPKAPHGKLGLAYLAVAANDLEQALKLVDDALQAAPEGQAFSFKAELHKRRGQLKEAEAAYTQAIEHRRQNEIDRANRALVRIELQKLQEAEQDIEILKKTAPKLYLTHFAEGYLKIAQGQLKEAKEPLDRALALNENYPFTLFYLGLVALSENQLQQADAYLSRFARLFPGSPQAHLLQAAVKYRQKDFQAARSLLMPVLLSRPEDPLALNLMANIELASGHPKEGLQYLQKLAELKPESGAVEARLGMGMLAAGLKEEGLKALEKALVEDPSLVQPEVLLATTYLREKQFEKAKQAIERLKSKLPKHPLPFNLEAMWHYAQGNEVAAQAALEQAWQIEPGHPTTAENLARLAFKNKQFDKVRQIYQQVLTAHPDNALARLRLAEMDFREGKFQAMEERLTGLIQAQPELLQPRLELAKYYLTFGQPERSQNLLEEIRSRYPEHPELLAVLAKAQLEAQQPKRALETAKALAKVAPASPLAHYLLAQAHAQLKDAEGTRRELEESLKLDSKFLPARLAMVKLLALERKPEQAQSALKQLAQDFPEDAEVLALQGWWAMRQRHAEEAVEYYQKALAKQPSSILVAHLANALWRAGNKEKAIQVLEEWNLRYPKDAQALYLRSGLYQTLGREQEARQALSEVLKISPQNPLALNDLAWLLRKEDPKSALRYAEQAYAAAPKSAQIGDTLGVVLLANHNAERALKVLEEAATLAPEDPSIRYHLALAQEKSQLKQEAIASLKQALASKRPFPERKEAEALLNSLQDKR